MAIRRPRDKSKTLTNNISVQNDLIDNLTSQRDTLQTNYNTINTNKTTYDSKLSTVNNQMSNLNTNQPVDLSTNNLNRLFTNSPSSMSHLDIGSNRGFILGKNQSNIKSILNIDRLTGNSRVLRIRPQNYYNHSTRQNANQAAIGGGTITGSQVVTLLNEAYNLNDLHSTPSSNIISLNTGNNPSIVAYEASRNQTFNALHMDNLMSNPYTTSLTNAQNNLNSKQLQLNNAINSRNVNQSQINNLKKQYKKERDRYFKEKRKFDSYNITNYENEQTINTFDNFNIGTSINQSVSDNFIQPNIDYDYFYATPT